MGTILASLTIVLLLRGSQSRDGGDKGEKGDERVLHFCGVFLDVLLMKNIRVICRPATSLMNDH